MDRESFWAEYYEGVARKGEPWLDYSNERVQAQTFGLVLEALGALSGRSCLDVGCGVGQMARTYAAAYERFCRAHELSPELTGHFPAFALPSLVEQDEQLLRSPTNRPSHTDYAPGDI